MSVRSIRFYSVASVLTVGVLVLLSTGTAVGQGTDIPVVTSAFSNFLSTPPLLTILGQNLGTTKPTVVLGGANLIVQSFSPTTIVADLPMSIGPGSYHMVVSNTQFRNPDIGCDPRHGWAPGNTRFDGSHRSSRN